MKSALYRRKNTFEWKKERKEEGVITEIYKE